MKTAPSPVGAASADPARGHPPNYLLALAVGALGIVALFGATLVGLERAGHLPPPQITNSLCVDEKLRFLRDFRRFAPPGFQPDVLAVGSSVSWRHFDGEAVEQATGGRAEVFNGAFCGLNISETLFAARYFLKHYRSVRDVVTILAPQDLTNCRRTSTAFFKPEAVDAYVYGRAWVFPLYLKYFDPFVFAKNIYRTASGELFRWTPGFDRFGGLPLDTSEHPTHLVYGELPDYSVACFDALHSLATETAASGRRLVVAIMPMHPGWLDRYDPDRRRMRELETRVGAALSGTGAEIWRPRTFAVHPDDFLDAIHIRWSAAKAFSRALARETGLGQMGVGQERLDRTSRASLLGQAH